MPRQSSANDSSIARSGISQIKQHMASDFRRDRSKLAARMIITMRQNGLLPFDGLALMLIAAAEAEERPHDISSLAVEMELPRTTVHRHLIEIESRGHLEIGRDGHRTLVRLSDHGWLALARNWEIIDSLIDNLVENQKKYISSEGPEN